MRSLLNFLSNLKIDWKSFLYGLMLGMIVGILLFTGSSNRYEISNSSRQVIKFDKLTGNAWVLSGNTWKKIRHEE